MAWGERLENGDENVSKVILMASSQFNVPNNK